MKNHEKTYLFITAILLVCMQAVGKDGETASRPDNLVIIVINGVRYDDAFGDKNHLYIDNIWSKLRPLGTICTRFDNSELTFPIPSQMSLVTGMWHVLKDPLNDSIRPALPTLFEYWNSSHKEQGNSCYFASNDAAFEYVSCSNYAGYGEPYAPVIEIDRESDKNNSVYDKVMPYISEKHPSFIYLSLGTGIGGKGTISAVLGKKDDCEPGQKDACASDLLNTYYESIILMDAIVYDLWDRMQQEKTYKDNTVFLVLSDHGRHTDEFHGFGDKCRGCRQLFMLAIGPGIKKGFVSERKRTLIDVCRTVGAIFAIQTPYAKGNIMKELFE
ncbi:MAG: sulfatase-like hydrolase/transferase [Deltaproteobacteria bacterium]|nr:sulfatase-like hydrolase/transferase [Deltaproteobacteria bacterium]